MRGPGTNVRRGRSSRAFEGKGLPVNTRRVVYATKSGQSWCVCRLLDFLSVGHCFVAGKLSAGNNRGIQGYVKDQTGAVVVGASVEIWGPALGTKKTETDTTGFYRFSSLPLALTGLQWVRVASAL